MPTNSVKETDAKCEEARNWLVSISGTNKPVPRYKEIAKRFGISEPTVSRKVIYPLIIMGVIEGKPRPAQYFFNDR